MHVLFVCLGNICRSPSAQAILEKRVLEAGLERQIKVDSCGTAPFNVGKTPDLRAIAACERRGYDLQGQVARQITAQDWDCSDYVLAMDHINLITLKGWAPATFTGELDLFMRYAPSGGNAQVADPYYGDDLEFDRVVTVLERAAAGLLQRLLEKTSPNASVPR
jgi:protein-tyrosine phosphatase